MDEQNGDQTIPTSESNNIFFSNSSVYDFSQPVCFWLFVIFDLFAVLCTVFKLYHLLTKRNLRHALRNHPLILMLLFCLVYELIDISLHLQFLITRIVRPTTPHLCLIWWFIDWGFYYTIEILLLFTSIERHILIFHSQMLATQRKRFLLHYLPMLLIVLFIMTFYSIIIFASICANSFDYTYDLCGTYACYGTVRLFNMLEQIGFSTTFSCLIAVFNIALLVRVIWQKHRIRRVFSLPVTIIYLVRLFNLPDWDMEVFSPLFFISYFAILFLPFVRLSSLPKLWDKFKNLHPRR